MNFYWYIINFNFNCAKCNIPPLSIPVFTWYAVNTSLKTGSCQYSNFIQGVKKWYYLQAFHVFLSFKLRKNLIKNVNKFGLYQGMIIEYQGMIIEIKLQTNDIFLQEIFFILPSVAIQWHIQNLFNIIKPP